MTVAAEAPSRDALVQVDPVEVDQRIVLHGVRWEDYLRLLVIRGESPVPRLTYLHGELELMSPSRMHEGSKTLIGRLVGAFAEERSLDLNGFGSWTIKRKRRERGAEPDECYILGDPGQRIAPDLAIEVEWTRGGIDKLEVYRGLGIGEVWRRRRGRIQVHVLRGVRYETATRSQLLPDLDLAHLASYLGRQDQTAAVRQYRRSLRRSTSSRPRR